MILPSLCKVQTMIITTLCNMQTMILKLIWNLPSIFITFVTFNNMNTVRSEVWVLIFQINHASKFLKSLVFDSQFQDFWSTPDVENAILTFPPHSILSFPDCNKILLLLRSLFYRMILTCLSHSTLSFHIVVVQWGMGKRLGNISVHQHSLKGLSTFLVCIF